jgi:chromosome segregation ATPase
MWFSTVLGFEASGPAGMDPTARIAILSSAVVGGIGVVTGSVVAAYKSFQLARIEIDRNRHELQKQIDRDSEGSLKKQLAETLSDNKKIRQSLHDLREQANRQAVVHKEEAERYADEIDGLREQVRLANEQTSTAIAQANRVGLELQTANSLLNDLRKAVNQQGSVVTDTKRVAMANHERINKLESGEASGQAGHDANANRLDALEGRGHEGRESPSDPPTS